MVLKIKIPFELDIVFYIFEGESISSEIEEFLVVLGVHRNTSAVDPVFHRQFSGPCDRWWGGGGEVDWAQFIIYMFACFYGLWKVRLKWEAFSRSS